MTRVLVTGFGPLGDVDVNPSETVVRALAADPAPNGGVLATAVLPTAYGRAGRRIRELLLAERPDACLLLGVAQGAEALRLETIARNRADSLAPDVEGQVAAGLNAVEGGPPAYLATLPVARMRERLRGRGVAAVLSYDAGGYVCNHVFYLAAHTAAAAGRIACGFVHVPDSWPPDALLPAVRTCLDVIDSDG